MSIITTIIIAKNVTESVIFLEDLGISIDGSSEITLSDIFHISEIVVSEDLKTYVTSKSIVINDGVEDLPIEQGLKHISFETVYEDDINPDSPEEEEEEVIEPTIDGYSCVAKITIDSDKVDGTMDLTDFPLLVEFMHSNLKNISTGGCVVGVDGYDMIFADGTMELDHEVEYYDPDTGELMAWVRIPTLSHDEDTDIYLNFGNSIIDSTSQENITGVWDNDYVFVSHMKDDPDSSHIKDSTINGNNGTKSGGGVITYVRFGGVDTGTSFSFDIGTADTDRLVVIMADDESTGTDLTNVTVDGKNCTHVTTADNPSGIGNHLEMWYIDEDGLGSSNGSVTVAIVGGDGGWGAHAHLYTGVSQSGPTDSWIDESSVSVTTVTVTSVDVPANGLVVMASAQGSDGKTATWTSPLSERIDGGVYDPGSADLASASVVETSQQTDKTYVCTWSGGAFNRGTGIVAVWGGSSSVTEEVGNINVCQTFGDGGNIEINGLLDEPGDITLSAWVNLDTADSSGSEIISIGNNVILRADDPVYHTSGFFYDDPSLNETDSTSDLEGEGWHYVVYTYNDTDNTQRLIIDGVQVGSTAYSASIDYTSGGTDTIIGMHGDGETTYNFVGSIDEVRISKISRSLEWAKTEYNNQSSSSTFYTVNFVTFDPMEIVDAGIIQVNDSEGNLNINNTTPIAVPFNVTTYKNPYVFSHDNSTNNSRVTVNRDGVYKVTYLIAYIITTDGGDANIRARIRKNGDTYLTYSTTYKSISDPDHNNGCNFNSLSIILNEGDYIEVMCDRRGNIASALTEGGSSMLNVELLEES